MSCVILRSAVCLVLGFLGTLWTADVAPSITSATAVPATVVGKTTKVTVVATDDGGAANLLYAWTATGPAAVTFGTTNGTNAGKSLTATFAAIGTYDLTVMVTDGAGQSAQATVPVTVSETLTSLTISPTTVALNPLTTKVFAASAKNQFGAVMTGIPLTWNVTGNGVVDAAGLFTAADTPGAASVAVSTGAKTATAAIRINAAPTVATAAATLTPEVTGKTAVFTVQGADDVSIDLLTYTWTAIGPKAVTFAPRSSTAGETTTATFGAAGNYVVTATISDKEGLSATSTTTVTVHQTPTGLTIAPSPNLAVNPGATKSFTTTVKDQFNALMFVQPTVAWTVSAGPGAIDQTGVYTAAEPAGSATISASVGAATGSVSLRINAAPTVAVAAATETPVVNGKTALFTVQGADDVSVDYLTYAWSATGPKSVSFSPRSSTNGESTTATFAAAGTYVITATITDKEGLSATSSTSVTVNQTVTGLAVSPSSNVVINPGLTKPFVATTRDQFNAYMVPQPLASWAVTGGTGSIGTDGIYLAGDPGQATVTASVGLVTGSATLRINAPPTVAQSVATDTLTITGLTASFTVQGADDVDPSLLTYSWSASGPKSVSFAPRSGATASATTATFTGAGSYTVTATITDKQGLKATSSLMVTVQQVQNSYAIYPATVVLNPRVTKGFVVQARDQFNVTIADATIPATAWSATGGTIDGVGRYVAGLTPGAWQVTAAVAGTTLTADVRVNAAPTVATPASTGGPNPTTTSVIPLRVLGADDGGEGNLRYTWSVIGSNAGGVVFSGATQNTTAAQSMVATVPTPGTFQFHVQIKDAQGQGVVSDVVVVRLRQIPTYVWTPPTAITYGALLSETQLNASSPVAGSWVYNPTVGTKLSAGAHQIQATFTPDDGITYEPVSVSMPIVVDRAVPTITWVTPAAIVEGTGLSATQLNAQGSVPGSISYNYPIGTVLPIGNNNLTAVLVPDDVNNYVSADASVVLVVLADSNTPPNDDDQPPIAPQVTLDIVSGLTGDEHGSFLGEDVGFTRYSGVGLKITTSGGAGVVSDIRIVGGAGTPVRGVVGSNGVALIEGRNELHVEVDYKRAGITVTGRSSNVVIIRDSVAPKLTHALIAPQFLAEDDPVESEENTLVFLNGMDEEDNSETRLDLGWSVYARSEYEFIVRIVDDETGLASEGSLSAGAIPALGQRRLLSVDAPTAAPREEAEATVSGFGVLADSISFSASGSGNVGPGLYEAEVTIRDRCGNEAKIVPVSVWVKTSKPSASLAYMPYSEGRVSSLVKMAGGESPLGQIHWVLADGDVTAVKANDGWFGLYWGYPTVLGVPGDKPPRSVYSGGVSLSSEEESALELTVYDVAGNITVNQPVSLSAKLHEVGEPTPSEIGLEDGRHLWITVGGSYPVPLDTDLEQFKKDYFGDMSDCDPYRFVDIDITGWYDGYYFEGMVVGLDASVSVLTRTYAPSTTIPGISMPHMPVVGDSFFYRIGDYEDTRSMGLGASSVAIASLDGAGFGGANDRQEATWMEHGYDRFSEWLTQDDEYHYWSLGALSGGMEYVAKECPPDGWSWWNPGSYENATGYYETAYKRYDELPKQTIEVFGASPPTAFRSTAAVVMPRPSWKQRAAGSRRSIAWMVEASAQMSAGARAQVSCSGANLQLSLTGQDSDQVNTARVHGVAKYEYDELYPMMLEWNQMGEYKLNSKHFIGVWDRPDPRAPANDSRAEVIDDSSVPANYRWSSGLPQLRYVGVTPDVLVAGDDELTMTVTGGVTAIAFYNGTTNVTLTLDAYNIVRGTDGEAEAIRGKIAITDIISHDVVLAREVDAETQPEEPELVTFRVIDSIKVKVGKDAPAGAWDLRVMLLPEALDFRYNSVDNPGDNLANTFTGGNTVASYEYPGDSGQAYAGANGTHRMREALLVGGNSLAIDGNRDGHLTFQVADRVSDDHPWRWWINDDADADGKDIDGGADVPGSGSNGSDAVVNGRRDLVDFFPVAIDLRGLRVMYPPSAGYVLRLRQADGALGVVPADAGINNAFDYLSIDQLSGFGEGLHQAVHAARVTEVTASGIDVPSEIRDLWEGNRQSAVMLVECKRESVLPLELLVTRGEQELVVGRIQMGISSVEAMYRWINLRGVVAAGGPESRPGVPQNMPDEECSDVSFIWVHGYNVQVNPARAWVAESYKRMYQSRMKARFVGVTWAGDIFNNGQWFGWAKYIAADYHLAVESAFKTASEFTNSVNAIPGRKVIMSHSLGAGLVGAAIQDFGLNDFSHYIAIDAAMPVEVYDEFAEIDARMIPCDGSALQDFNWHDGQFTTSGNIRNAINPRLWSAYWYRLFPSGDSRSALGWRGRLSRVTERMYNMYSSGEEVLQNSDGTWPDLFSETSANTKVWQSQEWLKGNRSVLGIIFEHNAHGGWGFNTRHRISTGPTDEVVGGQYRYPYIDESWHALPVSAQELFEEWGYTPPMGDRVADELNSLADSQLVHEPFFRRFDKQDELGTSSDPVLPYSEQMRILAQAIPATTFAAGSNELINVNGFDLDSIREMNGWPQGNDYVNHQRWFHSDIKDVAYLYVRSAFDRILDIGGGR